MTIPVAWTGTSSGSVVVSSNVPGPIVIIAYRSGYNGGASLFRVYVNGKLYDQEVGIDFGWQSGNGESNQPWNYKTIP